MSEINIQTKYLEAILLFACKHDIRYYLNGIRVIKNMIVATNGHMMIIHNTHEYSDLDLIIPWQEVATAIAFAKKKNQPTVSISNDHVGPVRFKAIEGTYPDFSRVIPDPQKMKVRSVAFNASYLSLIAKAAKLVTGEPVIQLTQNKEESPALVALGSKKHKTKDFVVIIMPVISAVNEPPQVPDWLREIMPKKQDKAAA